MNYFRLPPIFYILLLQGIFTTGVKLKINPNSEYLVKYVGDVVSLTCSIDHEDVVSDETSFFSLQHSHPIHTLNWILPSNAQDRVITEETEDTVVIRIVDLKETDSGNYTCDLRSQIDAFAISPPKKKIVSLFVLPRGNPSNCGQNSFHCERNRCIASRYECDGIPDCINQKDEDPGHCGSDACYNKLACEDGRCLSPKFCCRDSSQSPPNCSIIANIKCCRQFIHPALLDPDLYYLASRPQLEQDYKYQPKHFIAEIIVLTCLLALIVVMALHFGGCRMKLRPSSDSWSSLWSSIAQRRSANHASPTNQYLLQAAFSSLHPNTPPARDQQQSSCNLVVLPITNPNRTGARSAFSGPPPSYNQVIGAPPPPYSSHDDVILSAHPSRAPLLIASVDDMMLNNNNGDINGNSTLPLSVSQDLNMMSSRSGPPLASWPAGFSQDEGPRPSSGCLQSRK